MNGPTKPLPVSLPALLTQISQRLFDEAFDVVAGARGDAFRRAGQAGDGQGNGAGSLVG